MAAAFLSAVALTVWASELSSGQPPSPSAAVSIANAWVRAMPPSQKNTAAYLTLNNDTGKALNIVGAHSTAAAQIQMHNSRIVNGMMKMEHLKTVEVAPGERVEFAPGGMHLMVMGLKKMPVPGEQFNLCLELESMEPVCTLAQVLKGAPSPGDAMQNHQHH